MPPDLRVSNGEIGPSDSHDPEIHATRTIRDPPEDDVPIVAVALSTHQHSYLESAYQKEASLDIRAQTGALNDTGFSYLLQFEQSGQTQDINTAIDLFTQSTIVAPEGDIDSPGSFAGLGNSYLHRFRQLSDLEDLKKAIQCLTQALLRTPAGHSGLPSRLSELGNAYLERFQQLNCEGDLETAIGYHTQAVQLSPEGCANLHIGLANLGNSYLCRFRRSEDIKDLDQAITLYTRAAVFAPKGHEYAPNWLMNLASAFEHRFEKLAQVEDINQSIGHQMQAIMLMPENHINRFIAFLKLGGIYTTRYQRLGELQDTHRALKYYTQAAALIPDGHPHQYMLYQDLGALYFERFQRVGDVADVNRAIEAWLMELHLAVVGNTREHSCLNRLGAAYLSRFSYLGEIEDISQAIEYGNQALSLTPDGHSNKPYRLTNLGNAFCCRFNHSGNEYDIDSAIACQTQALSLARVDDPKRPSMLSNLGNSHQRRYDRLDELEDIDKAIACHTHAVSISSDEYLDRFGIFHNLGHMHQKRFKRLGNSSDVESSIAFLVQALLLAPEEHPFRPQVLKNLGVSHQYRLEQTGDQLDLFKAVECFQTAIQYSAGQADVRIEASIRWANLAARVDVSAALAAYRATMSLLPEHFWMGTTVKRRYELAGPVGNVVLGAAATAISAGEYSIALEWLEEGRSIVWNQILQLHSPFDDLAAVHPTMAQKLAQVSHELENASWRTSNPAMLGDQKPVMEQAAQQHHLLAGEHNHLVNQIRNLPGFRDFMRPKNAGELMLAARSGPIIVINVHATRCDALVLLPCADKVAHVPLPDLSNAEVSKLYNQMQASLWRKGLRDRGSFTTRNHSMDQFQNVLTSLWHKIVEPVFNLLGYMNQPPAECLPHITWCTTGTLSFLPIHAAGCYVKGGPRIFDYAVSSYTPTLKSLTTSSHNPGAVPDGVLVVGQEDTPTLTPLPHTSKELALIERHIKGMPSLQLKSKQATVHTVSEALEQYGHIHLACHASQDTTNPAESCFHLHDGNLSLAAISRRPLKNKGLAFLSACQTATGDKELPDEAAHLAAGMLVAGYPSVIASMWPIKDEDGPTITDQVYSQLVKDGKLDVTEAARALHAAVKVLRDTVGESEFARWAPYVHFGI